ncbi:helix-turn-helix domain-containing protein [Nocardia carnea]|uniref:helix-turn-helix domain-containing protein n=1 Tax=Nocardia carnea TaxID=37328 RepID=UPI00245559F0|nr:helix-turn-helix domain-containing protein [Nocardia carnea]
MRWLSTKQAADRLGVHPVTMSNWRRRGEGPKFEKMGTGRGAHIRYHIRDVDEWVKSGRKAADKATDKAGAA